MISVCMATYNGGKFIREQLESILSQLSSDAEIVIADDGSADPEPSILFIMAKITSVLSSIEILLSVVVAGLKSVELSSV